MLLMPDARPDPSELLARIQRDEAHAGTGGQTRGRLKIFFGMAPGVGKTFAMLAAAQRLASQGVDVAAGVVETHGRAETEQLLLGLDILPRKRIEYNGTTLGEFDVDAAIARRSDILLVDELAHTNAPGSARAKRWQDVQECLRAGLNVYTTLNVQHLESLNDVVTQITGVAVRETVPDSIFDEADEVELVDLPAEALHERLRAGKVYQAENAERAVDPNDGFFRKGNLTALRELALRRTAAWVDSELRRYKQDRGIRAVWPAGERILVAISPSPMSGRLIRAAKRMAAGLHADLLAVYVETPRTANLSAADRDRLAQNLRLAQSLGATTQTLAGENAAREIISFARSRNVGKIVVGKTARPRWREALFGSFVDNLIRESGDIDISVVRGDDNVPATAIDHEPRPLQPDTPRDANLAQHLKQYSITLGVVAGVTMLGLAAFSGMELANVAMVYLAAVVVTALWMGRGPGIFSAIVGVIAFDFFFVAPRFTLAVSDVQYLLTFAVMVSVGTIVGSLAARSREQTQEARDRERQTAAHYALSRELAAAQDARDVASVAARHAHDTLGADVIVAIPARAKGESSLDVLAFAGVPDWFDDTEGRERGVAQWSLDHGKPAGLGTQKLPNSTGRYVPLVGNTGRLGVLGLRPRPASADQHAAFDMPNLLLIDALASQVASALERVSLSESQQAARLEAERERLRSALLSSVSHDLRTPLASITGAATALQQGSEPPATDSSSHPAAPGTLDGTTRASLLRTIVEECSRLNDIIANLVFATRLESGAISLRREWTTIEEVVGVGLARHRNELAARPLRVRIPDDMPMIRVDNAMLPQVVHNLIENALRYTPPGTPISIGAWTTDTQVVVSIADEGPGLSEDEAAKVFQRFYRGRASKAASPGAGAISSGTGMGLGLTICEGIIKAHEGRIWAESNSPRGVAFMFSLPIEHPQPSLPKELTSDGGAT